MKKLILLLSYFSIVMGCGPTSPNNPVNTPPTVQLTSPAASANLSGNVMLAATATDTTGIASVQFQIDNQAVGAAVTTAPYQMQLDTSTLSNGPHTIRAVATNTRNTSATSAVVSVTVNNSTPAPTVSITSPSENDEVSAIIVVSADASATDGVASVQFQLDGVNQGLPDNMAPYELSLDTTGLPNGIHSLTAVVTSTSLVSTTSAPVSILVVNAPTVAITSPALNAVVSGTATITAIAGAIAGVNNVQFYIDGNEQDLPDDQAPYEISLDTTGLANGPHTVSALVTSNDNLTATSVDVTFIVTNLPVVAITNPSDNSSASGTIVVSASAAALAGIASVQFQVDGVDQGAPILLTGPYDISLDTTVLANGPHILTAIATSIDLQSSTSAPVTINVTNQPTIAITSPADNSAASGTLQVTAEANAIGGVASVQFKLDGADYLAADTDAPYEVSLDTTLLSNGSHTLTAVVNSLDSLSATSAPVTITVTNLPTVSITTPADNSPASGTVQVTAEANAIAGVASVQFQVDGIDEGAPISGSNPPYQIAIDTTLLANGPRILTAVVTSLDSLTATSTPVTINVTNQPTIMITSPADNSPASGTVQVIAAANAIGGIANVQFLVDGLPEGVPLTDAPYEIGLDTTLLTNGAHVLTAVINSSDSLTATSAPVTINVTNQPTIAITSPADNSAASGTLQVTAEANAIGGVASVQFKLDGSDYLAADTDAPYEVSLDTTLLSNGSHTLTAVVNSSDSLTATSAPVTINVTNQPTIAITSPADNSPASGTVQVIAVANAIGGIANVQFLVDGNAQGAPLTDAPYEIALDTTLLTNGAHVLTAVVNSSDSLTATSAPITINVTNAAPIANLIRNPSVEDIDPNDPNLPQYWKYTAWGTNDGTATYLADGRTGNRSLKIEITSYTDGASNWYPDEIAVTPEKSYKFSDYYKSDVETHVDVQVTLSDNSLVYLHLGDPAASPTEWTKFEAEFTVPANAVSVTIIHTLTSVGSLTTDDYSLTQIPDLNNAIVSITFDDSWADFYSNALPKLQTYGFSSTVYAISEVLDGFPDYMTASELQEVHALGHEIGSHTVSHPDLTTLSPSELDAELKDSQIALKALINAEVPNFAAPFGALNPQVVAAAKTYYSTVRGVEEGFNTRANFNPDNLLVQNVLSTTTASEVEGWIQQAIASKSWLILVYHHVSDSDPSLYNTLPADLDSHLAYLQTTGVAVKTVQQALDEILPQL